MIRIESHIENLLLSHDCVIVPGIGGFVTRYEGSYISDDGQELYPPYRSISFNSQLNTNDGLLTQSYMNAYDTSYPKAQSLVEENVKEIREQLHEKGEYTFKNIGKLQLTQSQSLIFTPIDDSGIFSKEHYGLTTCAINQQAVRSIENVDFDAKTTEEPESSRKIDNQIVINSDAESTTSKDKDYDSTHYVIRISKHAVRNTVATIAAALLYFIFTIAPSVNPVNRNLQEATILTSIQSTVNTSKKDTKKTVLPQTKKVTTDTSVVKTQAPVTEPTKEVIKEASKETPKVAKQDTVASKSLQKQSTQKPYTIVVASAISETGGNNLVEQLKKEKYYEAKFIRDGKMNRVIYSSYSSQREATNALNNLRASSETFSSAWVLKR